MNDDDLALTEQQIGELKELLERRRREVDRELVSSRDGARPVNLDLSIGRLTRVDALQQQHMAAARRRSLETQVAQIRRAFGRLERGTYGLCLRCGEPVSVARLRVRPEAPFCVDCQGAK